MPVADTIVAIATATGPAAVGIVRISGPAVRSIAQQLVGGASAPRFAHYCTVTDATGLAIDDAIVIYFAAPASFTGEDILEIQTHGGNIVTRDVLAAAVAAGARPALPGEFTERAFLNGKIDLLQAEAIADLITSTSSRAARLAHRSLAGDFSRAVTSLNETLKAVRVHLEASIDFPDEAISTATLTALARKTESVKARILSLLATARIGARLNSGIDIAIIGEPNVGKSTLLNRLAGTDRAIVHATPGTTRDVLTVELDIGGLSVRVHDTAGIRETDDPIEREGVRRARQQIAEADAVLYVFTDNEAPDALSGEITVPVFSIRNKIDLTGVEPSVETDGNRYRLAVSAKTDAGIDLVRQAILDAFQLTGDAADSVVLARERHLAALAQAASALAFDHASLYEQAPELGAEQLRLAGEALGQLTGEFTTEDLLGEIFSTFCLGK
jgi:tRNA modification GTPase